MEKEIQRIRRAVAMSMEDFAKEIGVSKGAVSKWESGSRTPNIESLRKIKKFCDRVGVEFNWE